MPAQIHSFAHLTTQKTRHAQTLIRECFAFSTHPCVSQPRFYESPDGEFISADKCFEVWWRRRKKLCYFTSCMASSYVLTETSRKGERKAEKSIINSKPKHQPSQFALLSILRLKKRGTLRHSSMSASLSQYIRVFFNLVFMSLQMESS